ncbi:MAG: hypothetical protein Q9170_007038 [Blastenia crenularia]
MVLETSMSDSLDAFPDAPDPYGADATAPATSMIIDRSQLPKQLPIIGPIFGFTEANMSDLAAVRLQTHSNILSRSLTRQESESILFHSYKSMAIQSYGMPLAWGTGVYQAWRTRYTYRFPGYGPLITPDGWWNGERIRLMGFNFVNGRLARVGVHAFRGGIYSMITLVLGGIFVSSYASTVAAVGEMRDPRLKDYQRAKRESMTRQAEDLESMGKEPRRQSKDPTGQGDTSTGDLWRQHRQAIGAQDDASPSAGAEYFGEDMERLGGTNTGIMSDAQKRSQEARQQASPRNSATENRASTFQLEKVENQPSSFDDTFGDSSASSQDNPNVSQGGSAWDRIRSQAQKQSTGSKQGGRGWDDIRKEQQAGSTTGDSFTFSAADEEPQLAQDEAQKEFDAKVEKERQGGNFNDNRGKRW